MSPYHRRFNPFKSDSQLLHLQLKGSLKSDLTNDHLLMSVHIVQYSQRMSEQYDQKVRA